MNRPPWFQHRPVPDGGGAVPCWLADPGAVGSVWAVEASAPSSFGPIPNDQGFVALQAAYRPSGGLARSAELAGRLQHRRVGGYVSLARLVVNRQVFSFTWHNDYWLPLFQFDADDLSLLPAVQDVLAELLDIMDGWSLALWFVQANAALGQHSPLALLPLDPAAVRDAAVRWRYAARP